MAQLVKNLPAMQETWVQSLGWEDRLEKGRLPTPVFWPEESHGRNSPWGRKESDTAECCSVDICIETLIDVSINRRYMVDNRCLMDR